MAATRPVSSSTNVRLGVRFQMNDRLTLTLAADAPVILGTGTIAAKRRSDVILDHTKGSLSFGF
jgi:hypothetical protein